MANMSLAQISDLLIPFLCYLVALSVHELSHGLIAYRLGDNTAKSEGRITLDPRAHIDLFGTILVPLFLTLSGSRLVFGWAKPVHVNPFNFRNPRRDMALVSIAGPASNFGLALVLAFLFRIFVGTALIGLVGTTLELLILTNLVIGLFNLIPISPLDGFKVVSGVLPFNLSVDWEQLAPYGIYLLLLLMLTPTFNMVLNTVVSILGGFLLGI